MSEEVKEEILSMAKKMIEDLENGENGGLGFNLSCSGNPPWILRFDKIKKTFVTDSSYECERKILSREEAIDGVAGSLQLGGY